MADNDDLHQGPQRQAIPAMLVFLLVIGLIAIAIVAWFLTSR